jgi:hypothetical protein
VIETSTRGSCFKAVVLWAHKFCENKKSIKNNQTHKHIKTRKNKKA